MFILRDQRVTDHYTTVNSHSAMNGEKNRGESQYLFQDLQLDQSCWMANWVNLTWLLMLLLIVNINQLSNPLSEDSTLSIPHTRQTKQILLSFFFFFFLNTRIKSDWNVCPLLPLWILPLQREQIYEWTCVHVYSVRLKTQRERQRHREREREWERERETHVRICWFVCRIAAFGHFSYSQLSTGSDPLSDFYTHG